MAKKVRKQLYIDRAHDDRLKALAGETGRSEADIVREAVEQYRVCRPPTAPLDHVPGWKPSRSCDRSPPGSGPKSIVARQEPRV